MAARKNFIHIYEVVERIKTAEKLFHHDKQLLNFLKNLIKIKDIFLIGDLLHC